MSEIILIIFQNVLDPTTHFRFYFIFIKYFFKYSDEVLLYLSSRYFTWTGEPSLGMTSPLGILQVSSLDRTWTLQYTPSMVMVIFMHELTVFSLLCCERRSKVQLSTPAPGLGEDLEKAWTLFQVLMANAVTKREVKQNYANVRAEKLRSLLFLEVISFHHFQREWRWRLDSSQNASSTDCSFHPCEWKSLQSRIFPLQTPEPSTPCVWRFCCRCTPSKIMTSNYWQKCIGFTEKSKERWKSEEHQNKSVSSLASRLQQQKESNSSGQHFLLQIWKESDLTYVSKWLCQRI